MNKQRHARAFRDRPIGQSGAWANGGDDVSTVYPSQGQAHHNQDAADFNEGLQVQMVEGPPITERASETRRLLREPCRCPPNCRPYIADVASSCRMLFPGLLELRYQQTLIPEQIDGFDT